MSAASVSTDASARCAKRCRNPASTSSTDLSSSEMAGEVDGLAGRANVVNPKDRNSRAGGMQSRSNRSPEALLRIRSRIDRREKRLPAGSYRNRKLDGFDDLSYSSKKLNALFGALGETETRIHHDGIARNAE